MAAIRTIGYMHEFQPERETVTAYLERFQLFVSANAIEADKMVPTLLTVVGPKHYSLLRGLVSPALPKEKSYDELSELLTKHYDPEPILIAERFHFYRRNQRSGESIAEYLACLRRMASRCKFGAFLSEALRDRLVCGMASENTQKVLLTKANLTLEKAVEISQGMEAAAKQSKELSKGSQRSTPVLAVETPAPARPCGRCGRGKHSPSECKFKTAMCDKCGKIGHIAPACRSRTRKLQVATKTKWVASESAEAIAHQEEQLFVIQNRSTPPYRVQLEVGGKPLTMEVDTGAAVSLAPESAVTSLLSTHPLLPSSVILKTYTGEQIPVKGALKVNIKYGQQQYTNLTLFVIAGPGSCLMGRDWLRTV